MDCFAEPVIGRRFAPTRWLAMTTKRAFDPAARGARAVHESDDLAASENENAQNQPSKKSGGYDARRRRQSRRRFRQPRMTAPCIPSVARLAHDLFHHIGLRANLPASVRAPHLKIASHVLMLSNKIAIP